MRSTIPCPIFVKVDATKKVERKLEKATVEEESQVKYFSIRGYRMFDLPFWLI